MTHIVSIVGDPPGAGCGMGDFVGVLDAELASRGFTTGIVLIPSLHLGDFPRIRRELTRLAPSIIHFQFPSQSLGKSPAAGFLPLSYRKAPWLISLCELAVFHPLRQASLVPLCYTFDGCVFTSQQELDHAARLNPRLKASSAIIPAVSNVPVRPLGETTPDPGQRDRRVVYFGQIVPRRGIEEFLELARLAAERREGLQLVLAGATPDWARSYCAEILNEARAAGCEIKLNLSMPELSDVLHSAAFGYFPYPDGASLKRGTLPAALEHRLLLLTRWSAKTEPDVRSATVEAASPGEALAAIRRLRADAHMRSEREGSIDRFNRKYSLAAITDQYLEFYARFWPGARGGRLGALDRERCDASR